jgi:hypothetical protein
LGVTARGGGGEEEEEEFDKRNDQCEDNRSSK